MRLIDTSVLKGKSWNRLAFPNQVNNEYRFQHPGTKNRHIASQAHNLLVKLLGLALHQLKVAPNVVSHPPRKGKVFLRDRKTAGIWDPQAVLRTTGSRFSGGTFTTPSSGQAIMTISSLD